MKRRNFICALSAAACGRLYAESRPEEAVMAEGNTFRKDAPKTLWKWSKEAYHYEKAGGSTKCLICPNHCELSPGDRSACRVKVNIDGTAYTLAYGNPTAVNADPVEKKPLFHFHPGSMAFSLGTAGCNLRCLNCQNWEISQKKPEEVKSVEMFPPAVVEAAMQYRCKSVAFTYSESTSFYEYMFDTAVLARKRGLANVWVTNGYMSLAGLEPLCPFLDAANVDLKSFSEETYNKLNGGHLKPVLETLKVLKEHNVWTEVTTLMVPGYTDNLETAKGVAGWMLKHLGPDAPLHFSRFHPAYKLEHLPPTATDILVRARETAMRMGLRYVYVGNVPGLDMENTICPGCKKTVVRRQGFSIAEMNLDKGRCRFCGTAIAGRFA